MHPNSHPRFHLTRVAALAMVAVAASFPRTLCAEDVVFTVGPYDEQIKPILLDGPKAITLKLVPISDHKIVYSTVANEADMMMWKPVTGVPHAYHVMQAFSSQEFVHVDGKIVGIKPGSGEGSVEPDPFHVTIPAVDIDWTAGGDWIDDETKEDSNWVWINDQTNGSFKVLPPLEIEYDMFKWNGQQKNLDMTLTWNANSIDVLTNGVLVKNGSLSLPWKTERIYTVSRNKNAKDGAESLITLTSANGAKDVIKCKTYSVRTETVAATPADRARRTIGVAEEVDIYLSPRSLVADWTTTAGTLALERSYGNGFTAPFTSDTVTVTANVIGESLSIQIVFTVLEPSGYKIDKAVPRHYPTNCAVSGMYIYYRVTPLEVSFSRVEIREVPMWSTDATGYFADTNVWPRSNLYHSTAGHWVKLEENNATENGFDEVESGECNPPWSEGSFSWSVPNEWRVIKKIDEKQTAHNFTPTDQFFSITSSGTVTVKKFEFAARRRFGSNKYYDDNDNFLGDLDE